MAVRTWSFYGWIARIVWLLRVTGRECTSGLDSAQHRVGTTALGCPVEQSPIGRGGSPAGRGIWRRRPSQGIVKTASHFGETSSTRGGNQNKYKKHKQQR